MARKTAGTGQRVKGTAGPAPAPKDADRAAGAASGGLRPWHLLLLASVAAVGASVVATRGTAIANVASVAVTVATAALVAAAAARTAAPLVAPDAGEQTEMLGGRTRAALEREKMLVLRSIKEVEFDRAMHKISEADFQDMSSRLRSRAAGLMRQLDQDASGYRALIEREVATRLGAAPRAASAADLDAAPPPAAGTCPACGVVNDADARFCKACGARLEVVS